MEENLNDKKLRDKLQQAEYDPDPAAWANMEAMLDRRDRRRGGVWWWWFSAAALLVVSCGAMYTIWQQQNTPAQTALVIKEKSQTKVSANKTTNTPSGSIQTNSEKTTPGEIAASASTVAIVSDISAGSNSPLPSHTRSTTTSPHQNKTNSTVHSSIVQSPSRNTYDAAAIITTADKTESTQQSSLASSINSEILSIALQNANELAMSEERNAPEKLATDETIPTKHLKHKMPIHYALGVTGNMSESYIFKTFAGSPSWGVGICEEIGIGKYFGITTGILYSETHFTIDSPKYPDYVQIYPSSYSSHIQQIDIPIGVKVYPYTQHGLRLSIGAAYVNHIKLKETFDYVLQHPINSTSVAPTNYYVTDIPFGIKTAVQSNPNSYDPYVTTAEYSSLATSNRYYGGLQFTAGIDYTFKKHFVISVEPTFNMTLAKVVYQNARLYNFGMNVGFKYGF